MRGPVRILFAPFAACLLAGCLLASGPSIGRAAEGLYLTWNDCALDAAATHDLVSGCASDLGEQALYCAFGLSAPVDSVLGLELVVDVQSAAPQMPDWWRFDLGGCRAGNLSAGFVFPPFSPCGDFFHGNAAGGLQDYSLREPRGGAGQARIKVAASVLPSVGGYASLDAEQIYYAVRLTITNAHTAGAGPCAGCSQPACLVLNSILLRRQPGTAGGDLVVSVPGPGLANRATWQSGLGADCAAVPVRAVTWGRIKGLYR
jgi:hypothetical protein